MELVTPHPTHPGDPGSSHNTKSHGRAVENSFHRDYTQSFIIDAIFAGLKILLVELDLIEASPGDYCNCDSVEFNKVPFVSAA